MTAQLNQERSGIFDVTSIKDLEPRRDVPIECDVLVGLSMRTLP
ncbi:hypothetical protein ACVIJ6_007006 [Bradyrhizobium sp. USDA 4369]